MWTTKGIPIGPFLDRFLTLARAENYKYILLLIARPADEYSLYENLYTDWRSIHEATGPDIMFLFVGPDAKKYEDMAGFLWEDENEGTLHFSPYIAVAGGEGHPYPRRDDRILNGYDFARLTEHVRSPREFDLLTSSHEAQIRDLRRLFSLRETELPALALISLRDQKRFAASIRGVTSLYPLVQCLIDEIERDGAMREALRSLEAEELLTHKAQKSFRSLRSAIHDHHSQECAPVAELKLLLEKEHPWDSETVVRQIHELLLRAKIDPMCGPFYKAHRGRVQRFAEFLHQLRDSTKLIASSVEREKAEIEAMSTKLLETALNSHAIQTYRGQSSANRAPSSPRDVFISYSRHDLDKAVMLETSLKKRGYSVWRDQETRAGFSFRQEIRSALLASKAVIVIWSAHSVKSEWVEWEAALAQKRKRYLPVSDGTVSEFHLPAPFGNYHFVPLEDLDEIERNLARLFATIEISGSSMRAPLQVEATPLLE